MKRIICGILFICFFVQYNIAQELAYSKIKEKEIKIFLKLYINYKDPNPIWQEDADEINNLIKEVLSIDLEDKRSDLLLAQGLKLLYENSTFVFEDAVDVKRMSKRKLMSYLTISLLSDEYRYKSFIEDARGCLKNIEKDIYKEEAIINIVEILMLMRDDNITLEGKEERIKELVDSVDKVKDEIEDKEFVDDFYLLFF